MLDKERITTLYLKGYNAVEIAKNMNVNKESVRKCIQRNLGNLKLKHDIAVAQRKDSLRAIKYESKKYISDRAFILSNRSAYKTLDNGDIVLNREVAGAVTDDIPTRLVNENKCII